MQSINRDAWNALLTDHDAPFIRHEFLQLLETSESACSETGWTPCHLTLHSESGDDEPFLGAAPLYIKQHSYGEYVFD